MMRGDGTGNHLVVYVANGSHANYYFGPSRYGTSTEVLGARLTTSESFPIAGDFIDFTTSLESGIRKFPEVRFIPTPEAGGWSGQWRWLNFRGKWGSKGMSKLEYHFKLLLGRSIIGDAPDSLALRQNWDDPFGWADHDCIDPLSLMDNWLTNEYYLRL